MKSNVNVSINSIETKAVTLLQKTVEEKIKLMKNSKTIKDEVMNYIFSSDTSDSPGIENPFQEINEKYEKEIEKMRERIERLANIEKQAYLGKSKKSVRGIKTVVKEISEEVVSKF